MVEHVGHGVKIALPPSGEVHSIAVDETWELKRSWISVPM
jgi:hypothetical protein